MYICYHKFEKWIDTTPFWHLAQSSETRISLRDIGANKWRHSSEKRST